MLWCDWPGTKFELSGEWMKRETRQKSRLKKLLSEKRNPEHRIDSASTLQLIFLNAAPPLSSGKLKYLCSWIYTTLYFRFLYFQVMYTSSLIFYQRLATIQNLECKQTRTFIPPWEKNRKNMFLPFFSRKLLSKMRKKSKENSVLVTKCGPVKNFVQKCDIPWKVSFYTVSSDHMNTKVMKSLLCLDFQENYSFWSNFSLCVLGIDIRLHGFSQSLLESFLDHMCYKLEDLLQKSPIAKESFGWFWISSMLRNKV